MNQRDNETFTGVLRKAIEEARRLGYPPNEFSRMLEREGGFDTVKRIVPRAEPSSGFYRLSELHRVDLTCEAIIVESEWRRFFDADMLEIAEKRLRAFGYAYTPYAVADVHGEESHEGSADAPRDFEVPIGDDRERRLRNAPVRPGQDLFRELLREHYGSRCCISGCGVVEALEAAHITAYRGPPSDHVRNGLLLRADLHTLFDRYLLAIDPATFRVVLSRRLRTDASYRALHACDLAIAPGKRPSPRALAVHWEVFQRSEQELDLAL